jgi:hypothetical protein
MLVKIYSTQIIPFLNNFAANVNDLKSTILVILFASLFYQFDTLTNSCHCKLTDPVFSVLSSWFSVLGSGFLPTAYCQLPTAHLYLVSFYFYLSQPFTK